MSAADVYVNGSGEHVRVDMGVADVYVSGNAEHVRVDTVG